MTLPPQASRSILTACPADHTCVALVDLAIRPHPSADNPSVNINDVAVAVAGAVNTFNFQVGWQEMSWFASRCLFKSLLWHVRCAWLQQPAVLLCVSKDAESTRWHLRNKRNAKAHAATLQERSRRCAMLFHVSSLDHRGTTVAPCYPKNVLSV